MELKGKGKERLLLYRDQLPGAASTMWLYCSGTVSGGRGRLLTAQKGEESEEERRRV